MFVSAVSSLLSLAVASGGSLSQVRKLLAVGLLPLRRTGPRACRLSGCSAQAQLLRGTRSLPGPEMEPGPLHCQVES